MAPVFGEGGAVVGAVSLAGPVTRSGPEALPGLRRTVLAAAAEVSAALGGPAAAYRGALAAPDAGAGDGRPD